MKKKPFFSKKEKSVMAVIGLGWLLPFCYNLFWTTGARKPSDAIMRWDPDGKYQVQIDRYYAHLDQMNNLTMIGYILFISVCCYIAYKLWYKKLNDYKRYPIVEGEAKVIGKRTAVDGCVIDGCGGVGTYCYVTFEYSDQQRVELLVGSNLYGTLMVGDTGKLKSQGYYMLDFQRHLKKWDLRDKTEQKTDRD